MNQELRTQVKQVLQSLRGKIESLQEENATLRDEITTLQDENDVLYVKLQQARRERSSHESSSFMRRENTRPVDALPNIPRSALDRLLYSDADDDLELEDIQVFQLPRRHSSRPRAKAPKLSAAAQVYARTSDPVMVGRRMGRGLDAEHINPAKLQPKLVGDAPPLDLGFVNSVGADELDQLPYGLIILDANGDILFYNETEGKYVGMTPEEVTGLNFFKEVAPCTQVQAFQGRFEDFVAGRLGRVTFFDFAFHFERGTQNVTISFGHGRKRGHYNVMLVRR
ncbi:MAG: PAS domain-containing protein [Myxococcota bacterium]